MNKDSLFDQCDVCISSAEDIGWLDVYANAKGREIIQATFPTLSIERTERKELLPEVKMPQGWSIACLHLPNMMKKCPAHKLMQLKADPDNRLNIYGRRLAVTQFA